MKKIFTLVILLMGLNAHALTLEECNQLSDAAVAKEFITAIRLGAIGSYGSESCLQQAERLKVETVSEMYEGEPDVRVSKENAVHLINVVQNGRKYTAIYEVVANDGKVHRGEFGFFRTKILADPESINTLKCGSIYSEPTVNFIDERCAQ